MLICDLRTNYGLKHIKKKVSCITSTDVPFNGIFCWLFAVSLAVDTFSSLPFFCERVDDTDATVKCHAMRSAFEPAARGLKLLPRHASFTNGTT